MVKKKDRIRFGTIILILLFIGIFTFISFYSSNIIDENFVKASSPTSEISRDDLRFVDVFYEIYMGCNEVDRKYKGDISLVYSVDYPNGYNCEFYVDGNNVRVEDGHYIRNLDIFREHSIKITCRDYLDNRVSKTKRLKNYC